MIKQILHIIPALILLCLSCSCGSRSATTEITEATTESDAPKSNPDSLYQFVAEQVAFGPRVPGSEAHRACADYIVAKMNAYGADTVIEQRTSAKIFTGETKPIRNILARFNPEASNRILLLAHYDTRPWADEDPNPANRTKPLDGANDGASGVAVLLELARQLNPGVADTLPQPGQPHDSSLLTLDPSKGLDLLFVDLEDSGTSGPGTDDTWCLGTQAFTSSLSDFYPADNLPQFAILLDMVGGQDAVFPREYLSDRMAGNIVDRIWSTAYSNGLSERFPNRTGGSIIDDHLYINRAGIPCVDIIESANPSTGSFPPTWHTLSDNLSAIDRNSLSSVANLLLVLIRN